MDDFTKKFDEIARQHLPDLQRLAAAILLAVDVDGIRDRKGDANGADGTALELARSIVWYVAESPAIARKDDDGREWDEGFAGLDNTYMALQYATGGTAAYPAVLAFIERVDSYYTATDPLFE